MYNINRKKKVNFTSVQEVRFPVVDSEAKICMLLLFGLICYFMLKSILWSVFVKIMMAAVFVFVYK